MQLLCPSPANFSYLVKKKFKKKFSCKFKEMSEIEFNKECHKYNIILTRFNYFLKYKNNTNIKYILTPTTGLDHIDKKFFTKKKIKIFSLKGHVNFLKNVRATIEFTIFLILASIRGKSTFNNKYKNKKLFQKEVYKKKIGIIGYGRVGQKIHKILNSFDAKILIYEKGKNKSLIKNNYSSLKNLIKNSDIISIHIPLNKKNEKFLNSSNLKYLKKKSILINTSRGNVLDENFVFSLVKKKRITYFTDVISKKILQKRFRMLKSLSKKENFFFSGHIAGLTMESIEKTDIFVYKNFIKSIN